MRTDVTLIAAAVLAASCALALAQADPDHAAHHPEGASVPASAAKKAAPATRAHAARPKKRAPARSIGPGGMGAGMRHERMQRMHDEMHKPGGMHDSMMKGMPAQPAASQ